MMSLTDSDIMVRVQAGDREVFGVLVARYASRLQRVAASKVGDAALAEDLVQETFLAAYGARATYNPEFAFSTWIWTILLNLCKRHWRRSQRDSQAEESSWFSGATEDRAPDALTELIHAEDRRRVHAWLNLLPEAQADALRLRFFGGLSFDEIATTMNCSLSGAKRRVKTGLERLSQRIRSLDTSDNRSPVGLRKEEQE
jgi:RNA polymerase sigma-70 factor (ECF subfamily)